MTPSEKEELRSLARKKHLTMSDYIRQVTAKPPDVTKIEYQQSIQQTIYEIHKIGVNLNQIAKKYNEHNYIKPSEDLVSMVDELYRKLDTISRCIVVR